ncbi:MAG: fibronectin type III domain-containing protein [Bifidobacteriaceae bacterium]|jgi:hypothetical protein|nr:fibronectin type III domain-containing protein [Bifidobacteriaceae bacterium]
MSLSIRFSGRLVSTALVAAVGFAGLLLPATAALGDGPTAIVSQTFDGGVPSGWTSSGSGSWSVQNGVLKGNTTGVLTWNRLGFGSKAPDSYNYEADFRFVSAASSRWLGFGVDWNASSNRGSLVVIRSGTQASNGVELAQKSKYGLIYNSAPTKSAPFAVGTGTWHKIAMEVRGSSLKVRLDGKLVLEANNLSRDGYSFGFAQTYSVAEIDNVVITELPPMAPPSAPLNVRSTNTSGPPTVTWDPPATAGVLYSGDNATITGYQVAIRGESSTSQLSWIPVTGTSHTFSTYSTSQQQVVYVRAVNGDGAVGPEASAKTLVGVKTLNGLPVRMEDRSGVQYGFNQGLPEHVQGFTVDTDKGYVYYAYSKYFVKADLAGNVLGTMEDFHGHLGDLAYNPEDGRVYGSLFYWDDYTKTVGGSTQKYEGAFYVAIIDVDKIDSMKMSAQTGGIMTAVFLHEVAKDYRVDRNGNGTIDSVFAFSPDGRYGAAGVDGIAFGPKFGSNSGKQYLTVAYSIFSHPLRVDNDYQILLQYDITDWAAYEEPVIEGQFHDNGPQGHDGKYFVLTGNQVFGAQNLTYDQSLDLWLITTYPTIKFLAYPLYTLFAIQASAPPTYKALHGVANEKGQVLSLAPLGRKHLLSGVRGWFSLSFGMESLGNGYFYLAGMSLSLQQGSDVKMAKWTGDLCGPWDTVS